MMLAVKPGKGSAQILANLFIGRLFPAAMMRYFAMLALILLAAGCAGTTGGGGDNWRTGTQGLVMSFVQNLPPSTLYDDMQFQLGIEVANRGAYALGQDDAIYLSGFDSQIMPGINQQGYSLPGLVPKDKYSPGDKTIVLIPAQPASILQLSTMKVDKYTPNLLVTACYDYETVAAGSICIDPQPQASETRTKVCTPGSVSLGSQAAPIAVTGLTQEPASGTTRFTITISNSGGGTVFKQSAKNKCSPYDPTGIAYTDVDLVELVDVKLGQTIIKPSCKPSGNFVRLQGGSAKIYCQAAGLTGTPYMTTITVTLKYGYRQTIEKTITILPR